MPRAADWFAFAFAFAVSSVLLPSHRGGEGEGEMFCVRVRRRRMVAPRMAGLCSGEGRLRRFFPIGQLGSGRFVGRLRYRYFFYYHPLT